MKNFVSMALLCVVFFFAGGYTSSSAADPPGTTSLVVKFVSGLSSLQQAAVISRNGGTERGAVPVLRLHTVAVPQADVATVIQAYRSDPQVERVEVDATRQAEAGTPSDLHFGVQWSLLKIGWDNVFGTVIPSGSALVALLDTGVDASHPDLAGVVIPGTSLLDGSNGLTDPSGHGTYLAGILAAVTDNGTGIAGVGFQGVKVQPVTVLGADGSGRDSDIIAGIIWAADHGADVILMAFSNTDFSYNLQDAIDYAWSKGCVLVSATGNSGLSTPTFPAGGRGVIGVSATDETDLLAAGSNFGLDTFLAAPGTNIFTTSLGGSYTYVTGTSASSAIVAGVAGFLKATDPSLINGAIVGRLATSADAIGSSGDPDNPLKYGNGRVNMTRALTETSTNVIQPAGAAPVGSGGPYVGPYTAAASPTISAGPVTPNTAFSPVAGFVMGTQGNSFTTSMTVLDNGTGNRNTVQVVITSTTSPPLTLDCAGSSAVGGGAVTWNMCTIPAPGQIAFTGVNSINTNNLAILSVNTPVTFTVSVSQVPAASTDLTDAFTVVYTKGNMGPSNTATASTTLKRYALEIVDVVPPASGVRTDDLLDPVLTVRNRSTLQQALQPASTGIGGGAFAATGSKGTMPTILAGGSGTVMFSGARIGQTVGTRDVTGTAGNLTATAPLFSKNITVIPGVQPQTITFLSIPEKTFGDAPFTVSATGGGSGNPVTFTAAPSSVCSAGGTNNATITIIGAGGCTVTASQAGNADYYPASEATQVFTVKKAPATVTLSGLTGTYSGSPLMPIATTIPAGLGVIWSNAPQTNSGSHLVTATVSDGNYEGSASGTLTIDRAVPANLVWPTSSSITYGQSLQNSILTGGSASVPGTFSFGAPATRPNAGSYAAPVIFTPTDGGNYSEVAGTVTVAVLQASSIIIWGNPADISYGTLLSATQLNASALPAVGSFLYVPGTGTLLNVGAGQPLSVSFTPADPNYLPASATVHLNVTPAPQSITFAPLPNRSFGDPPFTVSATASSLLPVTFSTVTPAVCMVTDNSVSLLTVGTCTVRASQGGGGNYQAAPDVDRSFTVNAGPVTHFTFANIAGPETAGTPFGISLTARDSGNNTATSFSGTVNLAGTAGIIAPATATVVNGVFTGNVTVSGAGEGKTITVTEPVSGASGTSNPFDVHAGAAIAFTVTTAASATAGVPFDITVTAKDAFNNVATGYRGTIRFTGSDTHAGVIFPVEYSFQAGDNGSHTFSSGVVLETAGVQTVTATDTATGLFGISNSVTVGPAGATRLLVTAPATATAGASFDVTVTVKDSYDNTVTNYAGTVRFTSSDPNAAVVLPADYSFQGVDAGSHTFTNLTNLKTAGMMLMTAADIAAPEITGTSGSIFVSAGAATQVLVESAADGTGAVVGAQSLQAGRSVTGHGITRDAYGNFVANVAAEAWSLPTRTGGVVQSDLAVAVDRKSATFTGHAVGTAILRATSGALSAITSGLLTVTPGLLDHFSVTVATPQISGTPFGITITARDPFGNTATGFTGTTDLSVSGGSSITPAGTGNFTNGIWTGNVTVTGAGTGRTLTATLNGGGETGTSGFFDVQKATATVILSDLVLNYTGSPLTPSATTVPAGLAITWTNAPQTNSGTYPVTATVTDADYQGSASGTFTINKPAPANVVWPTATSITFGQSIESSTLTGGSASVPGTFAFNAPATMPNAGDYLAQVTFTPTDTLNYGPVSGTVTVPVAKAASSITWGNPADITYGTRLSGTQLNATAVPATGSFLYLPGTGTLLNAGTGQTLSVTFTPADPNYALAAATVRITVAQAPQTITFGELPSRIFGDLPFNVSATTSSLLPVSFASLTPAVCSVAGDRVSITGVGMCTIRASQAGNGNYNAAPVVDRSFTVNPGAVTNFTFDTIPGPQTAGIPFGITITARDSGSNTVTSFAGTVTLATTVGSISPFTATFVDGIFTGNVVITRAGAGKTITVTQPVTGISGTSNPFDVVAGPAVAFTVTTATSTIAGLPFGITVTAKDAYDNVDTGYLGTVRFTSTDTHAGITLPPDYTFLAGDSGRHGFSSGVALETAGVQTVSVTDMDSAIFGISNSISVESGTATKLLLTAPATATAGIPFDLTVTVKDSYDNTVTNYTGTIRFTSSDPAAVVLPANYTFLGGDAGSHTFTGAANLKSAGTRTLSAADTVAPAVIGTSGSILVGAGGATQVLVETVADGSGTVVGGHDVTAGNSITGYAVTRDEYGNFVENVPADAWSLPTRTGGVVANNLVVAEDRKSATFTGQAIGTATMRATMGDLSAMTSGVLTVTPGGLDHFSVAVATLQVSGTSFPITVTARDLFDNTADVFTGTAELSVSGGSSITPSTTGSFSGGIWTGNVTVQGAGSGRTVTATRSGGAESGTSTSFDMNKATATVVLSDLTQNYTGIPLMPSATTIPAGLGISWTNAPQINSGTYPVMATVMDANYQGSANGTFTIKKPAPANVVWPTATPITYGQSLASSTLMGGSASVSGTFAFDAPVTVPDAGSYLAPVTFTPTDSINYGTVNGTVTVSVAKAPSRITWVNPDDITYGTRLSSVQLNASAVPSGGSFLYAPPSGTLLNAGMAQPLSVTFTPADPNYANSTATVQVNVTPAPQSITFGALPSRSFGDLPFTVGATASSLLPVSLASLTPTVCAVTGSRVTILTVGTCSIQASQSGSGNYYPAPEVTQSFIVNPGPLHHFLVEAGEPKKVGVPFSLAITAKDAGDNTITAYSAAAPLTTTAGIISPTTTGGFMGGTWTGSAFVTGAGAGKTITVTDPVTGASGTSNAFHVIAGEAVAFTVTAATSATAGTPFDITVTAKDTYNNVATDYSGTLHFTSTDTQAGIMLPADFTFQLADVGSHTFSSGVVLETAGVQTVTVTDSGAGIFGISNSVAIGPGSATKFLVTAPATTTAGAGFDVTVTVRDAYDNTATNYGGTVRFTSSDPHVALLLPGDYTFQGSDAGSHTFTNATNLKTAGTQTLTATDTRAPATNGTSGSILVAAGMGTRVTVETLSDGSGTAVGAQTVTAGNSVTGHAVTRDAYGNFVGNVAADVWSLVPMTGGIREGDLVAAEDGRSATFTGHQVGIAALRATSGGLATNASGLLTVTSGPLDHFALTIPPSEMVGAPFTVTITARDSFTNTVAAFTGTADLSVSGGSSISPSTTGRFSGGLWTGTVTVSGAGSERVLTATRSGGSESGATANFEIRMGTQSIQFGAVSGKSYGTAPFMVTATGGTSGNPVTFTASPATVCTAGGSNGSTITITGAGVCTVTADQAGSSDYYAAETVSQSFTVGKGDQARVILTAPSVAPFGKAGLSATASGGSGTGAYLYRAGTSTACSVDEATGMLTVTSGTGSCSITALRGGDNNFNDSLPTVVTIAINKGDQTISFPSMSTMTPTDPPFTLNATASSGLPVEYSLVSGPAMINGNIVTITGLGTMVIRASQAGDENFFAASAKMSITVAESTVPVCAPPRNVVAPSTNSTGLVYLSWGSSISGATYVIEQSANGGPWSQVASSTTPWVNIPVTSNGTYAFQVKAVKTDYRDSTYTIASTVCTVTLVCGVPGNPVVPTGTSTGTMYVSWGNSSVSGVTYLLEQSFNDGPWSQVYSGTLSWTSVTAPVSGTYAFRIKAVKANYADSPYATAGTVCTAALTSTPPGSPVVPDTSSTGVISITWGSSSTTGVMYVLEQSANGGGWSQIYSGGTPWATVTVTESGTYAFRVKAVRANFADSAYVASATVCNVTLVCRAPGNLLVPSKNSTGTFSVSWGSSSTSGVSYILERSLNGGPWTQVYSGSATSTGITAASNGSYGFRVKATKAGYSDSVYTTSAGTCIVAKK